MTRSNPLRAALLLLFGAFALVTALHSLYFLGVAHADTAPGAMPAQVATSAPLTVISADLTSIVALVVSLGAGLLVLLAGAAAIGHVIVSHSKNAVVTHVVAEIDVVRADLAEVMDVLRTLPGGAPVAAPAPPAPTATSSPAAPTKTPEAGRARVAVIGLLAAIGASIVLAAAGCASPAVPADLRCPAIPASLAPPADRQ